MVTTPRSPGDSIGKQRRMMTERALHAAKTGAWDEALTANNELLALDPGSIEAHNSPNWAGTARPTPPTSVPVRSSHTTPSRSAISNG